MSVREHLAKLLAQNQLLGIGNQATRNFVQTRGFTLKNGGYTLPKNGFALPKGGMTLANYGKLQGKGFVKEQMRENNKEIEEENAVYEPDPQSVQARAAVNTQIDDLAQGRVNLAQARVRGRVRRFSNRQPTAAFGQMRPSPDTRAAGRTPPTQEMTAAAVSSRASPAAMRAMDDTARELAARTPKTPARATAGAEADSKQDDAMVPVSPNASASASEFSKLVAAYETKSMGRSNPVYVVRTRDGRTILFDTKAEYMNSYGGRHPYKRDVHTKISGMGAESLPVREVIRLRNGDEVVLVHRDTGREMLANMHATIPEQTLSAQRRRLNKSMGDMPRRRRRRGRSQALELFPQTPSGELMQRAVQSPLPARTRA